jgi:class 3 adenylate cyclase
VHVATGRIALAEGDTEQAVRRLREARDEWREVGAPFEGAQARVLLGVAFRRQGDEHAATTELEAALAAFERIGAKPDAERAAELLGRQQRRRTFLFTDIVGSTRLLETLGDEKWRKLLARHNELLEDQITKSGGEVVQQTGDGFFATFATPRAALEAAVAIQRALEAEIVAPAVRIGAHTGDAFQNDGAANAYGGGAVHLAARVGASAGAGEILASRETLEGAGTGFRGSNARSEVFKGFADPVEVISVDWK